MVTSTALHSSTLANAFLASSTGLGSRPTKMIMMSAAIEEFLEYSLFGFRIVDVYREERCTPKVRESFG
jgi:hypothetical protein